LDFSFPFVVLTIWDSLVNPFSSLADDLIGNPMLIGAVVFMFFILFMLVLFIPFEGMVVCLIPMFFIVFTWIPQLRIVVAIVVGIGIGLGLIKWVRR